MYVSEGPATVIRKLLGTFRHPDFPYRSGDTPMPFVVHSMFWVGFWMPIGAVVFVCLKLFFAESVDLTLYDLTFYDQAGTSDLFLGAGFIPLTVALIGIALAYGVWSRRTYPRYLSIIVLAAEAAWANVRMFQTTSISWEPIALAIGAGVSIKYLLTNPDVKEYYRNSDGATW